MQDLRESELRRPMNSSESKKTVRIITFTLPILWMALPKFQERVSGFDTVQMREMRVDLLKL